MMTRIHPAPRIALGAAVLLVFAATTSRAQNADARWEPWIGCWQPDAPAQAELTAKMPVVCVTPTSTRSAVQVATVENGAIVARDTINANGQQQTVNKQGCAGWQRAQWSVDGRRLYVRSDLTCTEGLKRTGTGLLAMSPEGEWLDVQSVTTSGNTGVRVMRYHEAAANATLPAELANANVGRQLATKTARASAGAPINGSAIVEAVGLLDTAVVQSWIVQRGRKFTLDAKALVALADAGVPGSVTDVLIGVSYPERFAVRQPTSLMSGGGLSPIDSARVATEYMSSQCFGWNPIWSTAYDPCALRYGYFGYGYNPYRYDPYGYGGYGYRSGYYYGGGFVYSGPIVVVKGDETHGQVVKGRGYTRTSDGSASSGSTSAKSGGSSSSGSSGSSSSGGSSSGGSSSSSGSSGSGRTAHPRPPL